MFSNQFTLRTDKHYYKIDVSEMTLRIYGVRVVNLETAPTKKARTVINFKREFDIYPKARKRLLMIIKSWLTVLDG